MKRKDVSSRSRSILPVALAIVGAVLLTGCATVPVSQTQHIGGASVSYTVAGSGSPAVVLEAGLGDSKSSWAPLFSTIARDTTVLAYDRPGYSPSFRNRFLSDKDGRRTGKEVATQLRELLRESSVDPPYVLVGHSIGGLYVLTFAKLYPEDVGGIVLVDGRPADFSAACESEAGMCQPPALLVAMSPPHERAEIKGMSETEAYAPHPQDLGDIPITVIAATERPITWSRAMMELWLEHQEAFAQGAANARYVEAAGSGHYVHHKRPELVASEIRQMLDQVRSAPGRHATQR